MTKKEWKVLIISGVLFVLGIITLILGLILGGAKEILSRTEYVTNEFLPNIYSIINEAGIDIELNGLDLEIIDSTKKTESIYNENVYARSEVEEIIVKISAGNFDIVSNSLDYYGICGEAVDLDFYMENNKLYILADAFDGKLLVPKNIDIKRLKIELGAGDMNIKTSLVADKSEINAMSGKIEIKDLICENVNLYLGMGDLELTDSEIGVIDVESLMGNIEIEADVMEKLSVNGFGNIDLLLKGSENDFNYKLNAMVGNLKIGATNYSGISMSKTINNDASKNIDIKSTTGNIEIDFY